MMSVDKSVHKTSSTFRYRDLFLALFCAFLGGVKGLMVSHVHSLGAMEIFGFRSIGGTCFILPIVIYSNHRLFYNIPVNLTLLARSLVGNIAVCGYYFGFVNLPIAEASVLFYSTPVFTVLIGCAFLKERCGPSEVLSVLLSAAGVALVCVPDFNLDYSRKALVGVVGCLVGAVAQAAALVIARKVNHIPPVVVSLWWAVVGAVFTSPITAVRRSPVELECGSQDALLLVGIALAGFAGDLSLVAALKGTQAVVVSVALTSEILWAFLLQLVVDGVMPGMWCVLGGLAIIGSMLVEPLARVVAKRRDGGDGADDRKDRISKTEVDGG